MLYTGAFIDPVMMRGGNRVTLTMENGRIIGRPTAAEWRQWTFEAEQGDEEIVRSLKNGQSITGIVDIDASRDFRFKTLEELEEADRERMKRAEYQSMRDYVFWMDVASRQRRQLLAASLLAQRAGIDTWTPVYKLVIGGLTENSMGNGQNRSTVTHVRLDERFDRGRLHRSPGEVLCSASEGSFGMRESSNLYGICPPSCSACRERLERYADLRWDEALRHVDDEHIGLLDEIQESDEKLFAVFHGKQEHLAYTVQNKPYTTLVMAHSAEEAAATAEGTEAEVCFRYSDSSEMVRTELSAYYAWEIDTDEDPLYGIEDKVIQARSYFGTLKI